jgi:hypothetical protein
MLQIRKIEDIKKIRLFERVENRGVKNIFFNSGHFDKFD